MATPRCSGLTAIRMRTPNAPSKYACDIDVQLSPGNVQRYALSEWYRASESSTSFKSILMESSCAIDVVGYNMDKFSNDAFMVLPATMLGEYYDAAFLI